MKWKHDDGYIEEWAIPSEVEELIRLGIKALKKYLAETSPGPTILEGDLMANYQLNAGDSVVVTLTDTDEVTGATVTPDAGSVTASLSSTSDAVVVDPSGSFLTVTAGSALGTGNTVTVNATVNGVASAPWTGTYDVVADVVTSDATALSGTFGTESAPSSVAPVVADEEVDPGVVAHNAAFAGNGVGTGAGQINPVTGRVNP